MFEYESNTDSPASKDPLFLERLDAFMQKSLADIRTFADRESRPFEETRRSVAQLHANYLFQQPTRQGSITSLTDVQRANQVRSALCNLSNALESLSETSGVQSFLLAVDPLQAADEGFLGGPVLGREFWRNLRGGGESGARAFRTLCQNKMKLKDQMKAASSSPSPAPYVATPSTPRTISAAPAISDSRPRTPLIAPAPKAAPKAGPARSIKTELYESVRNKLREVSGLRGAEMKWTNPERLDVYDVRLVGWPKDIPSQNPSSLKVWQNKQLLEAIRDGTMRFERISKPQAQPTASGSKTASTPDVKPDEPDDSSWSWAVNEEADGDLHTVESPHDPQPTTSLTPVRSSLTPPGSTASSSATSQVKYPSSTLPLPISQDDDNLMMTSTSNEPEPDPWILESVDDFDIGYSWDEGLDNAVLSSDIVGEVVDDGDGRWDTHGSDSNDDDEFERPRKRLRSEDSER